MFECVNIKFCPSTELCCSVYYPYDLEGLCWAHIGCLPWWQCVLCLNLFLICQMKWKRYTEWESKRVREGSGRRRRREPGRETQRASERARAWAREREYVIRDIAERERANKKHRERKGGWDICHNLTQPVMDVNGPWSFDFNVALKKDNTEQKHPN